jgi:hypothetical protein
MHLIAGAVIRIADPRVRPRGKAKWHICVCPVRRLFLRINSKSLWQPAHPLSAAANAFLAHDSYVELQTLHFFSEAQLRQGTRIGLMSIEEMDALAEAALAAVTLSGEHKEIIRENLIHPA